MIYLFSAYTAVFLVLAFVVARGETRRRRIERRLDVIEEMADED